VNICTGGEFSCLAFVLPVDLAGRRMDVSSVVRSVQLLSSHGAFPPVRIQVDPLPIICPESFLWFLKCLLTLLMDTRYQ
jgi:hypothetical protein